MILFQFLDDDFIEQLVKQVKVNVLCVFVKLDILLISMLYNWFIVLNLGCICPVGYVWFSNGFDTGNLP